MPIIVINSGYFDPIHIGHIECFKLSKELGDKLIVIVNNDKQTLLKKGYVFMNQEQRIEIAKSIKYVDEAILSVDEDKSVCKTLALIAKKYKNNILIFAKGGDRYNYEIPEKSICNELNIKIVDGLGEKIQSSSELISKAKNGKQEKA
jgi:D-beta-D-heptose 7-phosphate kinase/D-beta-D-heptose 1-phosphate adenosyltransferase